jgi:hypothetical protein
MSISGDETNEAVIRPGTRRKRFEALVLLLTNINKKEKFVNWKLRLDLSVNGEREG